MCLAVRIGVTPWGLVAFGEPAPTASDIRNFCSCPRSKSQALSVPSFESDGIPECARTTLVFPLGRGSRTQVTTDLEPGAKSEFHDMDSILFGIKRKILPRMTLLTPVPDSRVLNSNSPPSCASIFASLGNQPTNSLGSVRALKTASGGASTMTAFLTSPSIIFPPASTSQRDVLARSTWRSKKGRSTSPPPTSSRGSRSRPCSSLPFGR